MKITLRTRGSIAVITALTLAFVTAAPAGATEGGEVNVLLARLEGSSNAAAEFQAMSAEQQKAVVEYLTPTSVQTEVVNERVDPTTTRAASCYTYTSRAYFNNNIGQQIGSMWTTGRICSSGSTVTSATFVDGGGNTAMPFWSYKGITSKGGGVQRGGGYVYGAYKFELNAVGVPIQTPTYCSRVVGTAIAAHGDTGCGIG